MSPDPIITRHGDRRERPRREVERVLHYAEQAVIAAGLAVALAPDDALGAALSELRPVAARYLAAAQACNPAPVGA